MSLIVRRTRNNVYMCRHFAIMPGINVIPDAVSERVKNEEGFQEQIDAGYITVERDEENLEHVKLSGRRDLDSAREIAAMGEDEAVEVVSGMTDALVLAEVVRIDNRASVSRAAQEAIDKTNSATDAARQAGDRKPKAKKAAKKA